VISLKVKEFRNLLLEIKDSRHETNFLKTIYEKLFHLSNKIEDFKPQYLVVRSNFENEL
jgi:hypothetical protein